MRTARCNPLLIGLVALLSVEAEGADFFVAPGLGPGGNGSIDHPWSLTFALSHPLDVQPGDTIWLRGGTYTGNFTSYWNLLGSGSLDSVGGLNAGYAGWVEGSARVVR